MDFRAKCDKCGRRRMVVLCPDGLKYCRDCKDECIKVCWHYDKSSKICNK